MRVLQNARPGPPAPQQAQQAPTPHQAPGEDPTTPARAQRKRWTSRARRIGGVLLVLFAAIGLVAAWNFLAGPPGVGHFRSAEGREAYVAAYADAMDAMPEPTAVHDVQTGYGSVRVYEWSTEQNREQTPVLLVPGRATGVPMWTENLPALARERRILAFDALGDSGLSEQAVPFASFEDLARPVDDVVRRLAPEGAHLVGHSFGGATAAAYARHFPHRAVTLTLLEPALTLSMPPADLMFWAMVSSLPLVPDGIRETALQKVGGEEMESAVIQDDATARMVAAASEHFKAALPQPRPLTDEELSRVTMPTYVAIASSDSLAGGASAAQRAGHLPQATVQTWPNTTHSLPMQAAGGLEPVLLDFFAAHDPA